MVKIIGTVAQNKMVLDAVEPGSCVLWHQLTFFFSSLVAEAGNVATSCQLPQVAMEAQVATRHPSQ